MTMFWTQCLPTRGTLSKSFEVFFPTPLSIYSINIRNFDNILLNELFAIQAASLMRNWEYDWFDDGR